MSSLLFIFFFFNDTATTEIYTLSLHDALPIYKKVDFIKVTTNKKDNSYTFVLQVDVSKKETQRSEEHTSELQSRRDLVCRLLLEKKKYKVMCLLPITLL